MAKSIKDKLTPRVRVHLYNKCINEATKDNRKVILPKDLILSILADSSQNLGKHVIEYLSIDVEELNKEIFKCAVEVQEADDKAKSIHADTMHLLHVSEKICNEMQKGQIGTEHLILALLKEPFEAAKNIECVRNCLIKFGLDYEKCSEAFYAITTYVKKETSEEKENPPSRNLRKEPDKRVRPEKTELNPIENGLVKNLNKEVENKNEKIIDRPEILSECYRVLCRKKKRNIIIISEPGVGKTTLVESIAKAIVEKRVPEKLSKSVIYQVNLGNILAGTKYRGQFEERMIGIVDFLTKKTGDEEKIALFEEIHHLVKAGSSEGSIDASFIIKPKLSDDSLQCIGTTSFEDYRKFIMSDNTLSRKFRPIFLEEPSISETISILNLTKDEYEEYFGIKISQDIIEKCVKLSDNYIKNRFFPDKAFDILDEACSYQVSNFSEAKELEIESIYKIISSVSGVPITTLNVSELEKLSTMEAQLNETVIGQPIAIKAACDAIKRSRIGFKDKNKPIASFLFLGKTGVGKTYICKKLSQYLFGHEKIVRLDMSEYMEKHSISKINGAPPGYVGYDAGGQLTETIKHRPYCVILLDEIEKAHPDVCNLFLQVLDDGRLTDSFGKVVDFRNTVIIMTSNLSTSKLDKSKKSMGFTTSNENQSQEEDEKYLNKEVRNYFTPEFVNRLDSVIVFNTLNKDNIRKIFELQFSETIKRIKEAGFDLELNDDAKELVVENGYDEKYGARPMARAISTYIEVPLTNAFFDKKIIKDKPILASREEDKLIFSNKE